MTFFARWGRWKLNTRRQHVLRRIPSTMCIFNDCARVCGVVLDTSICHSRPTAARIAPRLYWQQSICSGGKAKCEDGKYAEGREKRFVSRAPLQLPVIFYRPKNGENTCNVRRRGTPTHVLCAAQTIRDGEAFSVRVITHTLRSRGNMACHPSIQFRRTTENNIVVRRTRFRRRAEVPVQVRWLV